MTAENFVYWLQGFFEISEQQTLSKEQTEIIKEHLSLVLNKVTPKNNKLEESDLPNSIRYDSHRDKFC